MEFIYLLTVIIIFFTLIALVGVIGFLIYRTIVPTKTEPKKVEGFQTGSKRTVAEKKRRSRARSRRNKKIRALQGKSSMPTLFAARTPSLFDIKDNEYNQLPDESDPDYANKMKMIGTMFQGTQLLAIQEKMQKDGFRNMI